MGDLDDFFAKKDKKKTKGKKNVIVAANLYDEMKKETKEKEVKKEKKKVRTNDNAQPASEMLRKNKEDEDWEDFDEPQDVNLEGLKVVNLAEKLKLDEDRQEGQSSRQRSTEEQQQGGGSGGGEGEEGGPWRKMQQGETGDVQEKEQPAVAAAAPAAPSTGTEPKRYLPPALRNQQTSSATPTDLSAARPLPRVIRRKNAPNINDVQEFPTLGPQAPGSDQGGYEETVSDAKFESVKDTGRSVRHNPQESKGEAVSLSNRWNNLKEECH